MYFHITAVVLTILMYIILNYIRPNKDQSTWNVLFTGLLPGSMYIWRYNHNNTVAQIDIDVIKSESLMSDIYPESSSSSR
jgi:accessory gene regulator protein AgrB